MAQRAPRTATRSLARSIPGPEHWYCLELRGTPTRTGGKVREQTEVFRAPGRHLANRRADAILAELRKRFGRRYTWQRVAMRERNFYADQPPFRVIHGTDPRRPFG